MDNHNPEQSRALQTITGTRLQALFKTSGREETTILLLSALATALERPMPTEALLMHLEALSDLTDEQAIIAMARAVREETKFFPSPARLRELAGVETWAQRSDREAREALQWLLRWLQKHSIEGRPTRGALLCAAGRDADGKWQGEKYEWFPAPPVPDRTVATLVELGAGEAKVGCELIAQHPVLAKDPDEYPSLGLKLSAAEKLEARWVEAWKRSA